MRAREVVPFILVRRVVNLMEAVAKLARISHMAEKLLCNSLMLFEPPSNYVPFAFDKAIIIPSQTEFE